MKKIYTHKILPVLAICMFVVFTLATSCFAVDRNSIEFTSSMGYSASISNSDILAYKNILIFSFHNDSNSFIYIFLSNDGRFCASFPSSNEFSFRCVDANNVNIPFLLLRGYGLVSSSKLNSFISSLSIDKFSSSSGLTETTACTGGFGIDNIVYTDYNVCNIDNSYNATNDIILSGSSGDFFQVPVVGKQTVLAPVMTETTQQGTTLQAEIQTKTLAEILGILPVVMIIIVSLIGLRKALRLLQTLLRSS